MRPRFEELAYSQTPMDEISLRRRWEPSREVDVYAAGLTALLSRGVERA